MCGVFLIGCSAIWVELLPALEVLDQVQVWPKPLAKIVLDADGKKISLGLKQLAADPWSTAGETYQAGQVRNARVTRVAAFGAFLELEPGVEGLVPASESGVARDMDLKKSFPAGKDIEVVVLEVDAAARRIRLSVKAVEEAREAGEVREYTESQQEAPAETFGSLADKLRDALKRP